MNIPGLLDYARKRCNKGKGAANDSQLAECLGVTRAALSNWRLGRRFPDWDACARIADATGLEVAVVLEIVGAARLGDHGGEEESPPSGQPDLPGFELATNAPATA